MKGSFIFSNKAVKAGSMNLQSWIRKASKEERIELAKQIASTVETSEDEIEYINTANLQEMHREERKEIAKKIVSTIPHDWGCASC
jgi:acyl-CoA reductase-like NAD-dependent aldehyde dehydrogenase